MSAYYILVQVFEKNNFDGKDDIVILTIPSDETDDCASAIDTAQKAVKTIEKHLVDRTRNK